MFITEKHAVQIVEHARLTLQNSACCELVSSELQWCDKGHSTNKRVKKHIRNTPMAKQFYIQQYIEQSRILLEQEKELPCFAKQQME